MLGGQPGPADVAKSFIDAVDDADWAAANDLVHSNSLIGDATNVIDLLGDASTTGQIANLAIDELDLQTTDSTVREESGEQAIVDLTVELDIPLAGAANADLQFNMRTEDGDWRVYDIGLR